MLPFGFVKSFSDHRFSKHHITPTCMNIIDTICSRSLAAKTPRGVILNSPPVF
jgi:hypothetical protein